MWTKSCAGNSFFRLEEKVMQENSLHLNLCLRKRREVHSYLSLSVSYNIDSKTIVAMMWHTAFTTTARMLYCSCLLFHLYNSGGITRSVDIAPWSLNVLNHQIAPAWSPVGHCGGRGAAAVATFPGVAGNVARVAGDTTANAGVRLKRYYHQHGVIKKTSKGIVKGCQWVSNE